jgi:hypothetical protein
VHVAIERQLAEWLGLQPPHLWSEVDDVVSDHFRRKGKAAI